MSDAKNFVQIVKVAPRSDVVVLLTCFLLTVVFDMVVAVTAGVVLASLLFMKRMAEASSTKLFAEGDASAPVKVPHGVILYEIAGPLFFGAAEKAMGAISHIGDQTRVVVLKMGGVPVMDETGLVAFESALNRLKKRKIMAVVSEIQRQPALVLKNAGIGENPESLVFCNSLDQALTTAEGFAKKS
jgi:SulP family sulfate permease